MAIIWSKEVTGKRYEVRSAGRTRRLYTDGVFHSQYHPDRAFAGSIWDLLWLPALFYRPGQIKRILLLGVGGGAVIHMLRLHARPELIDAIDINPIHIQIAQRYFGVNRSSARLIQADGISWLQDYNGPGYDMIIDDMYGEQDGEPARAIELDYSWINTISKHLNPNGVMILNSMTSKDLKQAACFTNARLSTNFKSAYHLYVPMYHNAVGAIFRKPVSARDFRKRLHACPSLHQLDFRIRKLSTDIK
jgi:spermidine synthase